MTEKPKFAWATPKGPQPEIYTNFVHVSWTLFDMRFQLGALVPAELGVSNAFVVEPRGAVTIAWAQAKVLRDILVGMIDSYEKTNGEITPIKLAPAPEIRSSVADLSTPKE